MQHLCLGRYLSYWVGRTTNGNSKSNGCKICPDEITYSYVNVVLLPWKVLFVCHDFEHSLLSSGLGCAGVIVVGPHYVLMHSHLKFVT